MYSGTLLESLSNEALCSFTKKDWLCISHVSDLSVEFVLAHKARLSLSIVGQKNRNINELIKKLPMRCSDCFENPWLTFESALSYNISSWRWYLFGKNHHLSRENLRKAGKLLSTSALDGLWSGICRNSAYNFADLADEFADNFNWSRLLITPGLTLPDEFPVYLPDLLASRGGLNAVRRRPASLEIVGKLLEIPGMCPLNVGILTRENFSKQVRTREELVKYHKYLCFEYLYKKRKDFLFGPELAGLERYFDWKEITGCHLLPEEFYKYEDYIDWGNDYIGLDNIPLKFLAKYCDMIKEYTLLSNLEAKAPIKSADIVRLFSKNQPIIGKQWTVISFCEDTSLKLISDHRKLINWPAVSKYHMDIGHLLGTSMPICGFNASINKHLDFRHAIAYQNKLSLRRYANTHRLAIDEIKMANECLLLGNRTELWKGIIDSKLYNLTQLAKEFHIGQYL